MEIKEKVMKKLWEQGSLEEGKGDLRTETAIDLTLEEVGKVIDEILDSKKSKRIIDKLLEEKGIPKEFAFQEKYFYTMQDKIKEELKVRLTGDNRK